jgi:hypothetical protein
MKKYKHKGCCFYWQTSVINLKEPEWRWRIYTKHFTITYNEIRDNIDDVTVDANEIAQQLSIEIVDSLYDDWEETRRDAALNEHRNNRRKAMEEAILADNWGTSYPYPVDITLHAPLDFET